MLNKKEQNIIINKWKAFFIKKGLDQELKKQYLKNIAFFLSKDLVIILSFDHLAKLLGRKTGYLASVVSAPQNHYRSFSIKKRSGGKREITAPYPSLLEMQYWVYHNILGKIKISDSAHGFARSKSIITNSKKHTGKKELLKLDLKDFFPSIGLSRIITVFTHMGYPNKIAYYLARICSNGSYLVQGAPTSPVISNIIAHKLDKRLNALAYKLDLTYTRYADDLTFSGDNINPKLVEYISNIIINEGFKINESKTRFYKRKGKRIVTGVSVSGEEIKLPKAYKRKLKQELFYIKKYGLESHMAKNRNRNPSYLYVLIGKINFWLSIEPENELALGYKDLLVKMTK